MSGYIETFETADDTYLEHFGIRGMHWGSRKSRISTGTRPKAIVGSNSSIQRKPKSSHGKTMAVGSEIGKALVRELGIAAVGSLAATVALKSGKTRTAELIGQATRLANVADTGYTVVKSAKIIAGKK